MLCFDPSVFSFTLGKTFLVQPSLSLVLALSLGWTVSTDLPINTFYLTYTVQVSLLLQCMEGSVQ